MSVYLKLQNSCDEPGCRYDKTVAVQKCGNYPYELSLRFASCNLQCGACFAAGYSWKNKYGQNRLVRKDVPLSTVLDDFKRISYPPHGPYNWLRILGGEPLRNEASTNFLFDVLVHVADEGDKFNNGVVIQTNGISAGAGRTELLLDRLLELYDTNPDITVAIETSIKGTNPTEFTLLSQTDASLFKHNLNSYYAMRNLDAPNLRSSIIAGFGISESYLLTQGEHPKSLITILYDKGTPTFHPSIWSDEFTRLYNDFTRDYQAFDNMFSRMPMYGIKDQFQYGWVRYALKTARTTYGDRWYDSKYSPERRPEVEEKFPDILERFFLEDNQTYYSALIKH